jgi:hypothetical protein
MSTAAESPTTRPQKRPFSRPTDPFGGAIPLVAFALLTVAIGFFPTFFAQLDKVDAVHMTHALLSIGWLVLVIVQAVLIRSRSFKWHHLLGWTSLAVFAALMVTSVQMVALMLDGHRQMPFETAKIFGYSDLTTLPLLAILYGAAIWLRKDRHVHSRLISATILVAIVPAVARMFFFLPVFLTGKPPVFPDGLVAAMHPTYILILGILAFAIYVDWNKDRLRWPFPLTFAWMALTYATLFPSWHSALFDTVARGVGSLG